MLLFLKELPEIDQQIFDANHVVYRDGTRNQSVQTDGKGLEVMSQLTYAKEELEDFWHFFQHQQSEAHIENASIYLARGEGFCSECDHCYKVALHDEHADLSRNHQSGFAFDCIGCDAVQGKIERIESSKTRDFKVSRDMKELKSLREQKACAIKSLRKV